MARCILRSGWLVLAFLLGSCSGGGGGGGGGDSPRLNVSPTSFTFTAIQNGATPAAQVASVSISGGSVAVGIQSNSASGFVSATFNITGQTTGTITLTPLSPSFVSPGTHTGTVVVRGCGDQLCSSGDVSGSPVSINITYTVQPQTGLKASPQSLSFTQVKGGPAPIAQPLGLSDTANASYAWTASIVYQAGQATGWLNINGGATASGASLPDNLSVSINPTITVGTLNATIHLAGNGKTLDVPVSYTVNEPTLTRAPAQLTFSAAAGGTTPNTQTVTLATQNNLPLDYTTSIVYGAGQPTGWLNKPSNGTAPGDVTVGVNTTNLSAGIYSATLTFATATQMLSVGVTYTLATSSITFTPGSASFAIGLSSTATALSQTVAVGSTGTAFSWTAASNQPWVTVSPTSGTTGSSVTLSLDPAQLDTLDPGQQSAAITFNYTAPGGVGATSTPLSVTLNLALPKISSVSPYVALSGTSREVILRGKGFNVLGVPLDFGGTSVPATSYTVVSDTEVRVTPPAFAAGPPRRIKFVNSLGNPSVVRSTADLVVVDAPSYAATPIAYPDALTKTPVGIVYDAERQALLVGVGLPVPGTPDGKIYRYTFSGGSWSAVPTTTSIVQPRHLALSLDGKNLIAVSDSAVKKFDPVTLTPGTSTSTFLFSLRFLNAVSLTNDGVGIVTTGCNCSGFTEAYRYSVASDTLTQIITVSFDHGAAGASADGDRVVIAHRSSFQSVFQYDATTGAFSPTAASANALLPAPAVDRAATRILIGTLLYNSNFELQAGTVGQGTDAVAAVLSPDGSKAYRYSIGGIVHTYDLAAPAGGVFPEKGTGTATPADPGLGIVMTISPDGSTLFIAGDQRIVVMPAPQ